MAVALRGRSVKQVLAFGLLATLVVAFAGCDDYPAYVRPPSHPPRPVIVQPPAQPPPVVVQPPAIYQPPQPPPGVVAPPVVYQPPQPPVVPPPQPPEAPTVWVDTVDFEPDQAAVQSTEGRWFVMAGDVALMCFEGDEAGARQALNVIRFYRMSSQCSIGRPTPLLQYYLVNGRPPSGPMQGETSLRLDPTRLDVSQVDDRWLLVQGNVWILDFGSAEAEARAALAVIRNSGFTHICFVGRPRPVMVYFRAGGAGVQVPFVQARLLADPACYSGPLPAAIGFRGSITVGQPCDVEYTFVRNDGAAEPVRAIRFAQPGVAEVGTELAVAQEGAGWLTLRILSPVVTHSNRAVFEIRPEARPLVQAEVIAQPGVYAGRLPATIRFRGLIAVGQPCEVQYAFVRSNGAMGPVQSLRFPRRGAREVFDEWTLLRDHVGWAAIQILSPIEVASNRAPFEVRSGGHHRIQVSLAADPALYCGALPATVDFRGLIAVSQPCEVEYEFVRSDNTASPRQRLRFHRPGAREVSTRWTVGWEGTGWQALRVVAPVAIESERAAFEVRAAAQPRVHAALAADPERHPGPLPAAVRFRGTISAGQPCDVTYVFVRSNNERSPVQTLRFPRPGRREVADAWTLNQDYVGWEAIQVLSPVRVDSERAPFEVKAQQPPVAVDVNLVADPPKYVGPAPAMVQFKAVIRVSRPCDVRYTFVRSDSGPTQPRLLRFEQPGAKEVVIPLRFTHDFTGWGAIQVAAPIAAQSAQVPIAVDIRTLPRVHAALAAQPAVHPGPLPATIRFKGTITVDQPCEVKYAFVRHDNTMDQPRVLRFAAAGSQDVATSLTLNQAHSGSLAIRILAPVALVSEKALYEVKVAPPPVGIQATLHALPPKYDGAAPATIRFRGSIKASQAGDVRYAFVYSDGTSSAPQVARFERPGMQPVEGSRQFAADAKGWAALSVQVPVAVQSERAEFEVNIREAAKVEATLRALPPKYDGAGPATIRFRGSIRAGQACNVQYAFVRSDGTRSAPQVVRFDRPGVQEVEETRQFAADAKGWETISIQAPVATESDKAEFEVNIREAAKVEATLRAFPPKHDGAAPATIRFRGSIKASQAGDVRYAFVYSDGTSSPPQVARFERPGMQQVEGSRQFAANAKGWAALSIQVPVAVQSDKAEFEVNIREAVGVQATLKAEPPKYAGPAAATVQFKGIIRVTQPGEVRYTFVRSDGPATPIKTLRFERPGAKDVDFDLKLTKEGSGWVVLKVVAPVAVESDKAEYEVKFEKPKVGVSASLTADPPQYEGPAPGTIQVKGVIRVDQACVVQYAFVRSDTGAAAPKPLRFDGPGEKELEFPQRFAKDFRGWVQLQVLVPVAAESAKVPLVVNIKKEVQPVQIKKEVQPVQPAQVGVEVALAVEPAKYAGKLPVDIHFKGTIRVTRACEVKYVFVRSDNTVTPERSISFAKPGEKPVADTWKVNDNLSGWEMLQVLAPVKVESDKAQFEVKRARR
jgi:hypothetical protein